MLVKSQRKKRRLLKSSVLPQSTQHHDHSWYKSTLLNSISNGHGVSLESAKCSPLWKRFFLAAYRATIFISPDYGSNTKHHRKSEFLFSLLRHTKSFTLHCHCTVCIYWGWQVAQIWIRFKVDGSLLIQKWRSQGKLVHGLKGNSQSSSYFDCIIAFHKPNFMLRLVE